VFSELVDEAVTMTGRADKRAEIVGQMNATIRECQTLVGKASVLFSRDLIETEIDPGDDDPYTWEFPRTGVEALRILRTAYYPLQDLYIENKPPGRIQQGLDHYYYGGPTYFIFKGCSDETGIQVAYYRYLPALVYYTSSTRPAKYDLTTQTWTYLQNGSYVSTLGTDALNEAAQAKVTNWLLDYWDRTVLEGCLAKIMLTLDDPRGPKHYSLYTSLRAALAAAEPWESLNF
jgi:hypothetical protein